MMNKNVKYLVKGINNNPRFRVAQIIFDRVYSARDSFEAGKKAKKNNPYLLISKIIPLNTAIGERV